MTLPRMRTIKEAAEEIKRADPETAIREYFIRDLVNSNKLPHVKAGKKILINMDKLYEYLKEGDILAEDCTTIPEDYGTIRAVYV